MKIGRIIFLYFAFSMSAFGQATSDSWAEFLRNPNKANYEILAKKIDASADAACARTVEPDGTVLQGLIGLLAKGNSEAIALGLKCRRGLDGGNLEDVTRAVASTIDKTPRKFLTQAKTIELTSNELRKIVRMLPSNVIDNDKERVRAKDRRIKSLLSVTESDLVEIRDVAISNLRN
jgi:hypothetical protein